MSNVFDVSKLPREGEYFVLPSFDENADLDYQDLSTGRTIWSIGRRISDGKILASWHPDLYQKPGFDCLYLL